MTWNDLKDTKWCNIQNRLDLTWLDFDLIDKNVKRLKELKGTNGPTNQCSDEPMDQPKRPKALHRFRKCKEKQTSLLCLSVFHNLWLHIVSFCFRRVGRSGMLCATRLHSLMLPRFMFQLWRWLLLPLVKWHLSLITFLWMKVVFKVSLVWKI